MAQSPADGLSFGQGSILTIEVDQLFGATEFGQRLARELDKQSTKLAGENRRIEAELEEEESELTALRATLLPEEFRDLADAFDKKVQSLRSVQDAKARDLAQQSEQAQRHFLQSIAPILEQIMNEAGASVVLDRRAVFISTDSSDITEAAVARIDAVLGDGSAAQTAPNPQAPDTRPAEPPAIEQ